MKRYLLSTYYERYLLSTYYVSTIILDIEDIAMDKSDKTLTELKLLKAG